MFNVSHPGIKSTMWGGRRERERGRQEGRLGAPEQVDEAEALHTEANEGAAQEDDGDAEEEAGGGLPLRRLEEEGERLPWSNGQRDARQEEDLRAGDAGRFHESTRTGGWATQRTDMRGKEQPSRHRARTGRGWGRGVEWKQSEIDARVGSTFGIGLRIRG